MPVRLWRPEERERNCQEVGGTILTNFISPPNPAATSVTKTLGTATGDLKGGTGIEVINTTTGANGIMKIRPLSRLETRALDLSYP